jgi:cobalamin synthase
MARSLMNISRTGQRIGAACLCCFVLVSITFPGFISWGMTIVFVSVFSVIAMRMLWFAGKPTYYRPRWDSRSSSSPHHSRLSLVILAINCSLFAIALVRRALHIPTTWVELILLFAAMGLIVGARWRDTGKWQ